LEQNPEVNAVETQEEISPEEVELITSPGGIIPLPPRMPEKGGEVGVYGGLAEMPTAAMVKRAADVIEAQMEAAHRVRISAIRCTSENDWTAFGESGDPPEEWKPYLMGTGCTKIKVPLKIVFNRDVEPLIAVYNEGKNTEFYAVFFYGDAIALNLSNAVRVQAVGCRTSKDGFFTKGGRIQADPGNIIKSAVTNWEGNAVRKASGLENPPWRWLEEAGLDIKRIQKKAGAAGAGQMRGGGNVSRSRQTRAAKALEGKLLVVDIGYHPNDDTWLKRKNALKAAGARFKLDDVTDKWFLDDTSTTRSLISKLDLIGQTEELNSNAG
jgi:hypothetical protein